MSSTGTLRFSRRLAFLLVVTVVFGLVMVYPPLRILHWLQPGWQAPAYLGALLFLTPFALRLVHERLHNTFSRYLSAAVMLWLGVCFIALSLLLPAELLVLSNLLAPQTAAQALLAAVAVLSAYGAANALRLHVRILDVNAPAAIRGQRWVQISDVHIGSRQPGFLRPIVTRINSLQADYVLITGDLVDMRGISQQDLAPLGEINAPVLFCIGNHERYVDVDDICQRLRNLGVQVLRNQSHTAADGRLQFVGIDDAESKSQVGREIVKLQPEAEAYRVLLYHRPDGAAEAARWGARLMLTGHTHRGQIVPFNFLVKRVFPQYYRSYQVDGLHLYVSPGTGTWGPTLRLGSKCEITLIRLL